METGLPLPGDRATARVIKQCRYIPVYLGASLFLFFFFFLKYTAHFLLCLASHCFQYIAVSASVADMLVHFFLAHIELLSGEDDGSCRPILVFLPPSFTPDNPSSASPTSSHASTVASTLFRMFSVALHSIAKFSDNEIILRPHLKRLVLLCQRNALWYELSITRLSAGFTLHDLIVFESADQGQNVICTYS